MQLRGCTACPSPKKKTPAYAVQLYNIFVLTLLLEAIAAIKRPDIVPQLPRRKQSRIQSFLFSLQNTFVLTLLLLEAGGNFSDEGRHVLFSATSSLMTFVLMVRRPIVSEKSQQELSLELSSGGPQRVVLHHILARNFRAHGAFPAAALFCCPRAVSHQVPHMCLLLAPFDTGLRRHIALTIWPPPTAGHHGPFRPQQGRLRSHRWVARLVLRSWTTHKAGTTPLPPWECALCCIPSSQRLG